jgi:PPOX class probable F420-dependent enzyme
MVWETNSEFGRRVARRLAEDRIIWLTTTDSGGVPQPRPVWFLWQEDHFLIYSRPDTAKLGHIVNNPSVALNFNGDSHGGDIIVFTGEAELAPDARPANDVPAYVAKYTAGFARINMTADQFAAAYSEPIRVRPVKLRGH